MTRVPVSISHHFSLCEKVHRTWGCDQTFATSAALRAPSFGAPELPPCHRCSVRARWGWLGSLVCKCFDLRLSEPELSGFEPKLNPVAQNSEVDSSWLIDQGKPSLRRRLIIFSNDGWASWVFQWFHYLSLRVQDKCPPPQFTGGWVDGLFFGH